MLEVSELVSPEILPSKLDSDRSEAINIAMGLLENPKWRFKQESNLFMGHHSTSKDSEGNNIFKYCYISPDYIEFKHDGKIKKVIDNFTEFYESLANQPFPMEKFLAD